MSKYLKNLIIWSVLTIYEIVGRMKIVDLKVPYSTTFHLCRVHGYSPRRRLADDTKAVYFGPFGKTIAYIYDVRRVSIH